MNRKLAALMLLAILLLGGLAHAQAYRYVASKIRKPFHYPTCKWALEIDPQNLQTFKTRDEAIAAGHRPCKVCDP